ncbi:MAG: 6-phosphogluconolactonase [Gemmatimonadales bacterium]
MTGKRLPAKVAVLPSAELAADAAAGQFVAAAADAIRSRGTFIVALSGGHTPQRLYELLATPHIAAQVDWSRVQVCWGDERCVPPDTAESNYRMAREALLSHVPLPAGNVHRMRGEDDPDQEAHRYDEMMQRLLGGSGSRLDLVLLGLGTDGHTASLFPGADAVHDSTQWVAPAFSEAHAQWRITLTPRLINAAAEVVFLVSGADKADMVARVLQGPRAPHDIPAQLIAPIAGEAAWILDGGAASALGG